MNEHTENPFKTHGPNDGTGRSWHDYFADIRALTEQPSVPTGDGGEEDDDTSGIVVLVPARVAVEAEYTGSAILGVRTLAEKHGLETKLGYAKAYQEGTVYKSGQKEGQMRDDVTIETLILAGIKPEYGVFKLVYQRKNDGKWVRFLATKQGFPLHLSDKELRDWIKDELPA